MLQLREPIPELSILNPDPSSLDGPGLLHHLVHASPPAAGLALDFLEHGSSRRQFSYQDLHALSDALAATILRSLARLRDASAVIPILLPQSPELYIAMLAILKAGRAFCPLAMDTPDERLNFILRDVSADLIVTASAHQAALPSAANLTPVFVDRELARGHPQGSGFEPPPIDTSQLAYVLYTSGSTGLPKAVAISHRAVTQSLLAHDRHIPRFARFLQFAAPTFDVSIFEIFFPLFRGCTLVACERTRMLNDLPAVISLLQVDAAELTPTVASNLLRGRASVPGLRLLLTIGEMLTQRLVDEFGGDGSRESILWGMYGPTEAAIHCTLQPSFSTGSPVGNIGLPLDTVSAMVVEPPSKHRSPADITILPLGEVGELVIGGPQLAEGYLNRPEITAQAFVQHPDYGPLYRTGDKARIRPDGSLECLGRIVSGQVKLRGQRIELGEIEQVISKLEGCHTVTVLIIEDTLVAFCSVGTQAVSKSTVIDLCKRWLPSYMTPSDVIFMSRMPQLPSGKIDKHALKTFYAQQHGSNNPSNSVPRDPFSLAILSLLHLTLGQQLSVDAELASTGLDSLRAIRVASMLREHGYAVSATDVLSAQTAEHLIEMCREAKNEREHFKVGHELDATRVLHAPDIDSFQSEYVALVPCTPLQEAMLAETVARPSAYCNWVELELSQPHSYSTIRKCLETLAQENEILRSGFFSMASGSTSFGQVIWKSLSTSQISQASAFSRLFSLGSPESLLRPLTIQVNASLEKPRLLFQIHHALYDGWSFDLLLCDLNRLLASQPLDPRPQYRDIARFFSCELDERERSANQLYWAGILRDYCPKPLPNFNGKIIRDAALQRYRVPSTVDIQSLYRTANRHAVNPQVFFQAAISYVLGLYLGSQDVVIGTVTSGRTIPVTGIENVVGPCIASLPFRLDFSKCQTAKSIIENTQRINREILRHCTLPLREILRTSASHSRMKLFDVLFVWQQSLFSDENEPSLATVVDSADDSEFSVTFELEPQDNFLLYTITFDPSAIPEKQVKYFSRQIDDVVNHLLGDIDSKVDAIGHCFAAHNLSIANATPTRRPINHGPAYAVEEWASVAPEKEALVFGSLDEGVMKTKEKLTYHTLNARANQLAHALLAVGMKKDQLVAVLMEKSVSLYLSILAVLKVGCGYVPIVPDTPIERIERILADSGAAICIIDKSTSSVPRGESYTVLNLDQTDLSRHPTDNVIMEYDGSHLAYAVFTSGSTGTPKGVLVTQDNLMSNLQFLSGLYPTFDDSRLLQSCSQAFDVSVFEIFFAWYTGICLCAATKDDLFQDFEAAIDSLDITHLSLTPTVAALVDPVHVPKVKFLVTAGEALTEHVRRQWAGRGLFQGYGPSETTNICTVKANVTLDDLINNIGPPFDNTSALVLDPHSNAILPRGAAGELCFGGTQVFRGYLNLPELNAKKILDHADYGRIYRSGDMGMILPDGSILFTGRSDDQIKIRGQRVELGEITSIILDHNLVEDCVTLLLEARKGVPELVSFWVPRNSMEVDFQPISPESFRSTISELFDQLALKLPSYMIPTHLVPISLIPMTAQAKADKRLLAATFSNFERQYLEKVTLAYEDNGEIGSLNAAETSIATVLAETLGTSLSEIRRTSSFYSLGLDSISAIRFSTKLREAKLGHFPVSFILKNPTIAALMAMGSNPTCWDQTSGDTTTSPSHVFAGLLPDIRENFHRRGHTVEKVLPCTPLQEAMLSSTQASLKSSYYNCLVFTVNGDVAKLKESWSTVFKRHQILRTAFVTTDDPKYAYAQVVLTDRPLQWDQWRPGLDVALYAQGEITSLLERQEPPVRLAINQDGEPKQLLFCCHHALYDGTAISVLLEEIEHLYKDSSLPSPVAYESYLQHMMFQDLGSADKYWSTLLANHTPTFFPVVSAPATKPQGQALTSEKTLQTPLSEALEASQNASTSLLSLVQATWAKLLHFYTGEDDVCFGNIVSGRALSENSLDRLVAPCFNTLPVRANFEFQVSNLNLIKSLHSINVDSLPFQLTPLRRIQAVVSGDKGHLFDTLVILQPPNKELDHSIWYLEKDLGDMDLPVVCEITQDKKNDLLHLTFHYQTSLLSDLEARAIAQTFDAALHSLVKFPQALAGDTIGFPSHIQAVSNLDFSRLPSENGRFLHSGFEQNAAGFPDTIALDFRHDTGEIASWSFRNLNEKANQIAHALIQHGVQVSDIVPIHMHKSPEFYASILGIMKSGAAFAPIHPELPTARKEFMVSELNPRVVVCTVESPLQTSHSITLLKVDSLEGYPTSNPNIQDLSPTGLAYCLYTSGSTGLPKAVSMEHAAPIQTIESSRLLVPWRPDSRLLQYAAVTFDMCYYDCFMAWTFGFTLCAASQGAMLNDLSGNINALSVDLLDLTPSVAISLSRTDIPSVRWLYCIGEAMSPEIVKKWHGACVNSYGPTEAAFCTTMFPVQEISRISVIGKPFPSTSFAVFSPRGERPLPVLGVGELYIGGTQLARGYHGKPQLSELKFVSKCGQRFYRSGDAVRMLANGDFEFLGRIDDQVKIRGLRVELGEINHVLQNCDENITSVSTQILRVERDMKDQLVSFLVPRTPIDMKEGLELKTKAKREAAQKLPSYMVPQFIILVENIPKSMAGKIDKNALSKIFHESDEIKPTGVLSMKETEHHEWTETELRVREIFAKLSGTTVEAISPEISIYQLGLDSISAVQIAAALRKLGYEVSAMDIMKNTNCITIAANLVQRPFSFGSGRVYDFEAFEAAHRPYLASAHGIKDADIEAIRPCTPLQKGMLSQFIAKDGSVYLNYLRLQLEDGLDLTRIRKAWSTVMKRHQMLRTGFVHLKDSKHAFAMVHFTPSALECPWEMTKELEAPMTADLWLQSVQRTVIEQLHLPPWRVRVIQGNGVIFLDLAMLHALFDAQSLRTIFDDVLASYTECHLASPAPLEPVIGTILRLNNSERAERDGFWTRLEATTRPTKFPNLSPLHYSPAPSYVATLMSNRPLTELEAGCRNSDVTLQAIGMASWATLLSAYVGEPSVTFGVVLSGRNFEEAESVVFPCITTVPCPVEVSDDKMKMLREIMIFNAGVQQHQFTPLNEIQKLMGHPNGHLFDTIFAYQKLPTKEQAAGLSTVVDERATIEYPISIELEPKDGRLELRLTAQSHVVPKAQANVLLKQLDSLVQQYLFLDDSPMQACIHEELYSITPAAEPVLPSEANLLHEFVEISASRFPHRPAFEFCTSIHEGGYDRQVWSYAELDAEGNRIAQLLISYGARPGELIAVCFDKCPEASFTMLGILKAGCAFVALDPNAPIARRVFMIEDSGAKLVLSTKVTSSGLEDKSVAKIINIDQLDLQEYSSKKPHTDRVIEPQDRSYCLYTSGTTGIPKGCELTHENAVQAMLAFRRLFSGYWDHMSRWLQFASFHFDVSVLEQYWSWSVGICVVSAPRDLIFEDLASSIRTLGITHIDLTPSLARILHPDDVPSLCKGVFITGGESLRQDILDVWGSKSVIYNGYGPTEATIGVTMYPRVPTNGKPSNIGAQFDNVGSYVFRPGTEIPVLRGAVGELCVSGKLVGKGYLNRPELTQERFPHLEEFGEKVYRTGDLVRILHDNTFDFLGRVDDQVKLRGQRLEIGEINSVVKQSGANISDVTTLVLKHPKQQKEQLVSFVVLEGNRKDKPRVLLEWSTHLDQARSLCQEKLPVYMVPTHFVAVSIMPLSPNNKADRKKLKEMYDALSINDLQVLSSVAISAEEWTSKETRIRAILRDTLDIKEEDIRKDSSFFEIGMDSISVIGVSKALKQAGFSSAAVSAVMKNSTIHRLAKALTCDLSASTDRGSIVAAQQYITAVQHRHRISVAESLFTGAREIECLAPCTALQQGMIARALESNLSLYFNSFTFELSDTVDIQRLQGAWQETFSSVQILRTIFANTTDGYVQAVLRAPGLPWKSAHSTEHESEVQLLQRLKLEWEDRNRSDFKRPFELVLAHTPLRKILIVHIFHALYDGISIELMFKAVWDAYNDHRKGQRGPPFQSALPYGPLLSVRATKDFWIKHLESATFIPFPAFQVDKSGIPIVVSRNLNSLAELEPMRRTLNVTAQAIAQACWLSTLNKYIKSSTTIGLVVSGRGIDLEDADQIIGPLFNTIPYYHRLHTRDTWASSIKRVHDFNVSAYPYQHTALRDIMKWRKRKPGQPLFDTLFVYQVVGVEDDWSKNPIWELRDASAGNDYPVALEIEQHGTDGLKLTLVTQGHISDEETSTQLLDDFEDALRDALENSDKDLPAHVIDEECCEFPSVQNDKPAPDTLEDHANIEWAGDGVAIREEIASLSGSDISEINYGTSIFELGLDSIDAIKLSSKLKKRGIGLPVSNIMRSLTIAGMLQHISHNKHLWKQEPSSMIFNSHKKRLESHLRRRGTKTDDLEQVLPLTPLQEAMVAEMISSRYNRYYNHDIMRISTDTDIEKLKHAWTRVAVSSPILRTSFTEVDDPSIDFAFAQIIHRRPHNFWKIMKVEGECDWDVILASVTREATTSNLSEPLFSIRYVETSTGRYLMLSIAHALYDGWSLGLLHADVQRAYKSQLEARPSYEPILRDILTTSGSDAAAFWRDFLSGAKPTKLPQITHGGRQQVVRRERYSHISLSEVSSFAKQNKISLQTVGQTVYSLVLASYTKSLDVVFGSVLSGRDDENTAKVLFPTMNTVAIRAILHGTRLEMLRYVQDNFTSIKQWQHFPLRRALGLAGVQSNLFESLFIYQKGMSNLEQEQPCLYESIQGQSDVEYPLCVEMEVIGEELVWRCAVKETTDEDWADHLLDNMDKALGGILEWPQAPTIEFGDGITSICGLPAFEENCHQTANSGKAQEDARVRSTESPTTKAIREVLAFASKTPEDEIQENMTVFHIGLDSISAIKVSSLLRKRGINLSVGEMLKMGTAEKMAQLVDGRTPEKSEAFNDAQAVIRSTLANIDESKVLQLASLKREDVEQLLPATAGQTYMLSMWLNTKGNVYYPEFSYQIHGSISIDIIQQAWESLVATNSILRTCFVASTDPPAPYLQAVLRKTEGNITDITGWNEQDIMNTIEECSRAQPYAHVFMSRNASTGWAMKLKIHHALYDGVSLPLMAQKFQDLCNGLIVHSPSNIFAKFLASSMDTSSISGRESFWVKYLGDITQNRLPQPSHQSTSRTEIFQAGLIPDIASIEKLCRKNGISTQSMFLAAYAKLYAALTSTESDQDVVIGIYLANRSLSIPDIAEAPIPTVNLIPLRVQAPRGGCILDLASQIHYDLQDVGSMQNAQVSLKEVQEWTGVCVDTWVNWLKLPEVQVGGTGETGGQNPKEVVITPVSEWTECVCRVREWATKTWKAPLGLHDDTNRAYFVSTLRRS
ncbi:hypothetical protein BS50DRAFT_525198 [Corynespora cassiicola Philippines]|uniref:Carrier domain-containing protein n=1 Tax=Corynespora cassiicola Philippines TaxID=1448308 RepID=A0A2T2NPX9_CORCC|nr:hypothetical protein BS50DRAFT_525198 [Corynespora cassiicola Philippines]